MNYNRLEHLLDLVCKIEGIAWDEAYTNAIERGLAYYHPLFAKYLKGQVKGIIYHEGKLYSRRGDVGKRNAGLAV